MKTTNIYLGGPLFSEQEIRFNKYLEKKITATFGERVSVYNPCNNEAINDKKGYADSQMIVDGDNEFLKDADVLIANLDGLSIDPGMASEIGYYYTFNRPILGLYTDSRQGSHGNKKKIEAIEMIGENQFHYANLYTIGMVKQRGPISSCTDHLLEELLLIVAERESEQDDQNL